MADEITIVVNAEDNFSGVLGNFGNIMTGIKSTIDLVSGAIQGAADFVGQFVDSASESEQAVARLEGVLQATGGAAGLTSAQLQGMANQLQEVTRFSDETILNGEAILLTFRNISGEMFERTVPAMTDMAEIFGSVDSAAMQLGKALNDPIAGMGALSRAGITFSEDQKKAIQAFMDTNDIASAQNIILTEVENQVRGLAEAMGDTFSGKVAIFNNTLDTVKETIGGALLPILGDFLGIFQQSIPVLIEFSKTLASGIQSVLPDLDNFTVDIESISNIFNIIASSIASTGIVSVIISVASALSTFWDGMLLAGLSEMPFVTVLGSFSTVLGTVASAIAPVALAIAGLAGGIEILSQLTDGLVPSFSSLAEKFLQWIDNIDWNAASNALAEGISSIDWGKVGNAIAEGLGYLAIVIGTVLSEIDWGALLSSIGQGIADLVAGLFGFINWDDMIANAETGFRYVGQAIVDGLQAGLQSAWNNFINLPSLLFHNFITSIKVLLGISSPSTVFFGIARDIIQGLIDGFEFYWQGLIDLATSSLEDFLNMFGIDISLGGTSASGLGSAGGGIVPSGTGTGGTGESGTVNNYFYGPVYFQGLGDLGYDCPSPNPLMTAGSGTVVTNGAQ